MFRNLADCEVVTRKSKLSGRGVGRAIARHPGVVIAGAAAILGVMGAGITAGMLMRRRWRSTYHNPYESKAFRRNRFADAGEYEAVGI